MKALTYTLTLLLSVSLMSSCSNNQFAQQEYDDMYYTAQDRQKAIEEEQARMEANRQAKLEQQRQREAAAAERTKNAYDQQDAQSARELNPDAVATYSDGGSDEYYEEEYYDEQGSSSYTTPAGATNVYNNYYYNNNRGAYDPWRYDPYWNSYASPWGLGRPGWGSGFSVNIGFNSWNSWCDPFDPWCGSAYYYDAYRPAWAWNGWGYRNSYARGYQDGFYNGFYGRRNYWGSYYNPTAVIVYNNASNQESGRRNMSYGPRSTRAMAAADLGTGRRAANDPVLRDNQRQRVQELGGTRGSMNGRTINGEGQRVRPATNNSRERVNPTERGVRPSDRTTPTSRPRSPRTEPGRSNDNARPQRQPTERTRPMPQNRPSPAPRDNGGSAAPSRRDNSGGSAPSRSRGGRGGAPLESNMDGNLERDRNAQRSSFEETSPAQHAIQPRERAIPAERSRYSQDQQMERRPERREAPAERYSSPQPQERTRTRPADNSGYSRPAPDRSYSAPAQRNSDNNRSYSAPAPRERSMPDRSYSNPSPSYAPSRPAPSYDNGGSRSSERSSSPSRSSGSPSGGSRTRGGN